MRWALTSRLEHSNQELLALSVCRDIVVFVVRKGFLEVLGVPGASLGRLRDVPGGPRGRALGSQGRARGSQGLASLGRPRGPRSVPRGSPGSQGGSRDVPCIPWILFMKTIPYYDSIISFHNIIP